ncbi:DUF1804 family protein [Shewanella xiamenensis]|uniref:DUF1804 family protein n=1 Tax=Shewanella xiamenensis TaxID=332186 RepID=UPI0008499B9E|nr:DUF1804 family protein [Shewanella xiamenensis]ODR86729.1 hypothetical protein ABT47_16170 [Shewanella xiamenensis]
MAYKREVKEVIREKYINGLSLAAAAKAHAVSVPTATRWKNLDKAAGNNWDALRAARQTARSADDNLVEATLNLFLDVYKTTLEDLKNSTMSASERTEALTSLADAYAKTVKSAGKADPAMYELAIVLDVLSRQIEFVKRQHPEYLKTFIAISQHFAKQEVPQHYGKR